MIGAAGGTLPLFVFRNTEVYMKLKTRILIFIIFAGILMALAGFDDAMLVMKGDVIDLNDSEITDYEQDTLIKGNIYFPVGCIATKEESHTVYGIPAGKTTTYYYLVCNVDHDSYDTYMNSDQEELNDFYVIFSTSDEEMIDRIDKLSDEWDEYLEKQDNGDRSAVYPSTEVSFQGRLAPQPGEEDYIKYRDECFEEWEFKPTEVATYRIRDGKLGLPAVLLFFGGVLLTVGGIAASIISFISGRKKRETEFY